MPTDVFFIRHGQSAFNAAIEEIKQARPHTGENELRERFETLRRNTALRDARLTPIGERQASEASAQARALGVDVILVSPLTRAIQTAVGLFGPTPPRIEVSHLHAERLFSVCDIGRPPQELAVDFPYINFGHLDEVWWHTPGEGHAAESFAGVEPDEVFHERVARFRAALAARTESRVAVVGHGLFFEAICGRHLENCEITRVDL